MTMPRSTLREMLLRMLADRALADLRLVVARHVLALLLGLLAPQLAVDGEREGRFSRTFCTKTWK